MDMISMEIFYKFFSRVSILLTFENVLSLVSEFQSFMLKNCVPVNTFTLSGKTYSQFAITSTIRVVIFRDL